MQIGREDAHAAGSAKEKAAKWPKLLIIGNSVVEVNILARPPLLPIDK